MVNLKRKVNLITSDILHLPNSGFCGCIGVDDTLVIFSPVFVSPFICINYLYYYRSLTINNERCEVVVQVLKTLYENQIQLDKVLVLKITFYNISVSEFLATARKTGKSRLDFCDVSVDRTREEMRYQTIILFWKQLCSRYCVDSKSRVKETRECRSIVSK